MHSPARWTDEGSLEMNSQNFRGEFSRGILAGIEDETRDARDAFARFLFAGRNGGGHQGSSAMRCDGGRNYLKRLARALHHIVPPRPMNVDIDKARHNGFPARIDFAGATRQVDSSSLPDGGNLA